MDQVGRSFGVRRVRHSRTIRHGGFADRRLFEPREVAELESRRSLAEVELEQSSASEYERGEPRVSGIAPKHISTPANAISADAHGGTSAEADRAELDYRRADALGESAGAFNLAALLHHRGDLPGAIAAYWRAEQRGHRDAAFNLGVLLYETGDLDGAEAAWRRSVEHRHANAATNLGFLLQYRGDLEGARAAYADAARWGDAVGARMAATLPDRTPHPGDPSELSPGPPNSTDTG